MRYSAILVLVFLASPPLAQQPQAPEIPYRSVPDFFKLPPDIYLGEAVGVAVNSKGYIFVFHRGTHPLLEFDPDGNFLRTIAEGLYGFDFAHAVRVDEYDNVWTVDEGANVVVKFSPEFRVLMVLGRKAEKVEGRQPEPAASPGAAPVTGSGRKFDWLFNRPTDIAFGPTGDIFISDGYGNSRVAKYNKDGDWMTSWGKRGAAAGEFHTPHTIVTDAQGLVYVGDRENHRIQVFDANGKFLSEWTNVGAPWAMCITPGPQQFIYTADGPTGRIRKLDLHGNILGAFGKPGKRLGQFGWVHEMACPSENVLFVGEILNWRVQKLILGRSQ